MDLKDKDFDFDQDLLNNIFEQLTLESIPDLSGTLDNLDNELKNCLVENGIKDCAEKNLCESKPQKFDLNNSGGNDFEKNTEIENEGNTYFSPNILKLNQEKVPATPIKTEIEDEDFQIIKLEPLTDSSSSDSSDVENETSIIERGKEKKKRSHKKKVYSYRRPPSPSEFKRENLLHTNLGLVLENNSSSYQVQPSLPSYLPFNACQVNSDFNISCTESYYVNSPDSGFGSPSPPIVSSSPPNRDSEVPLDDEDQEEKEKRIRIQEIYNSIIEEVKLYQIEESQQNSNIRDNGGDNLEQIFHSRYDPIDSVETNITGNPTIGDASVNYLDTPAEFQVPDEDFEDLFNEFVNELLKSEINQSTSGTICSSSENSDSVPSQNPVLCYRPVVQEESGKRKISYNIKDNAKRALRNSEFFDVEKYRVEGRKILKKIKWQEKRMENVKIIDYDEREKFKDLQQTNLHSAVIESNVEKVFCIIEAVKCYGLELFDINNKDVFKKTALDYAIKQDMPLLINYLKENNAVPAINV
ncbi:uncharacterized protein [Parasteatoda tepidariorum]|nr:uncharacterized protein LOC107449079 isoform X1 [Parasteatoda tepidariorum]